MRLFLAMLISVSVLPMPAYAADNAGVINGIWFSTSTFVEQAPVVIFAAIQNESSAPITGAVQFLVDGVAAGTTTFSDLPAQVERISFHYTFTPGVHTVSGHVSSTGDNQTLLYENLPPTTITVAALPPPPTPPPPVNNSGSATGGGGGGSGTLGGVATAVSQAGNNVLSSINPAAQSLAQTLNSARDALAERGGTNANQNTAALSDEEQTASAAAASSSNLFDVSLQIAQSGNLPLWRRGLAILSGTAAWLVGNWLWVIAAILALITWRMVRNRRKF